MPLQGCHPIESDTVQRLSPIRFWLMAARREEGSERNESNGLRLVLNLPTMNLIVLERKVLQKIPFSNTIKLIFVFKEGIKKE
jgi:hypothetical protein